MNVTRRVFARLLIAVGIVSTIPTPAPDHYQEFLDAIWRKMVRLTNDGYQIQGVEIAPEHEGTRLVQVQVNHEHSIVRTVCWEQKMVLDIT